jgi:hypothetical protein
MAPTTKPYRRLPGTGYPIFGRRVQLWQGAEHILLVEWDGYREFYKRFEYRDIQAFTMCKTNAGRVYNAVLGALFCILAALAIVTSDFDLKVFLLILAGVLGLFLLGSALSGPTCRCSLRTAVQTHDLRSLRRLRRARKVLARLRPLIAATQGQLAPEEIPLRMRELDQMPASSPGPSAGPQPFVVDDPNLPPRIV